MKQEYQGQVNKLMIVYRNHIIRINITVQYNKVKDDIFLLLISDQSYGLPGTELLDKGSTIYGYLTKRSMVQ